jgi:hypothetical protein
MHFPIISRSSATQASKRTRLRALGMLIRVHITTRACNALHKIQSRFSTIKIEWKFINAAAAATDSRLINQPIKLTPSDSGCAKGGLKNWFGQMDSELFAVLLFDKLFKSRLYLLFLMF